MTGFELPKPSPCGKTKTYSFCRIQPSSCLVLDGPTSQPGKSIIEG